jgi:hypothetical protein
VHRLRGLAGHRSSVDFRPYPFGRDKTTEQNGGRVSRIRVAPVQLTQGGTESKRFL